jgi:predicted nucleotidyltransferase
VTADRLIQELLDRVDTVNADSYFLSVVSKLWVFGSYLSTKEKIGDVDLVVKLERKDIPDWVDQSKVRAKLRWPNMSWDQWRNSFRYGDYEVLMVLKNRNSYLQIWNVGLDMLKAEEFKQIYPRGGGLGW